MSCRELKAVARSKEKFEADLVLIAIGFLGPESYLPAALGVEPDARSSYAAKHGRFETSVPGVFATGDRHFVTGRPIKPPFPEGMATT